MVSLFPPSCDVLGVTLADNGIATIEFSKEFASLSDTPAMESLAMRAIGVVCKQFHGVKGYKIIAGGKEYEPTVSTAATDTLNGNAYMNYYD